MQVNTQLKYFSNPFSLLLQMLFFDISFHYCTTGFKHKLRSFFYLEPYNSNKL